ncbi:MAG: transporter substrate-binding domain-containing protein [Bacteroidales bacterium]|nr:transporter substrate-binding domain-containing protein [Bacteroidales bacterium]
MIKTSRNFLLLIITIFVITFLSCGIPSKENDKNSDISLQIKYDSSYSRVVTNGKIRVLTHNNSTGYFVYKGQPMGFHYDLMNIFAERNNLDVELILVNDVPTALRKMKIGEADIMAFDVTQTKDRLEDLIFSHPVGYNKQVLVQRFRYGRKKSDTSEYIDRFIDLNGLDVYVQKGTVFKKHIEYLEQASATNVNIIVDSVNTMEELIQMVASGDIDYTVCDERIAKVNSTYIYGLDYSLGISIDQKLSWAMLKDADSLQRVINDWLIPFSKTTKFAVIRNKYFKTRHSKVLRKEYSPLLGGKLSPYDDYIKINAKIIGWDWRLLAAVIYQESRFNPNAGSWVGAKGLMQMMPAACEKFNLKNPTNPEESIRAGSEYLAYIQNKFAKDSTISIQDQVKFTLASYNVGMGHVFDARRLAEKYENKNSNWTDGVDKYIKLMQNPKYYNDSLVRYGYCRGNEPYYYVRKIYSYYEDYKNFVEE